MNHIKFITDSACDIPLQVAETYAVDIVPLTVTVDGTTYKEGYEISPEEFYALCETCKELPISAGVNAGEYLDRFEAAIRQGYEQVCVVCINGGGSNTYHAACLARDEFYDIHPDARPKMRIEIVDSRTYSIAYGIPVLKAAQMHKMGARLSDVLAFFSDWFDRVEIYFAPLTFDFVKRSGRVSTASAFVGQALGLRPIISIIEGKTESVAIPRGDSKVIPAFLKLFQERQLSGSSYGLLVGTVPDMAADMAAQMDVIAGYPPECINQAGPAITINGGPKLLACCFLSKEPRGKSGLIDKLYQNVVAAEEIVGEIVTDILDKIHDKLDSK